MTIFGGKWGGEPSILPDIPGNCNADGGQGIGAGHVCKCNHAADHGAIGIALGDRGVVQHGCTCGAIWSDQKDVNAQ